MSKSLSRTVATIFLVVVLLAATPCSVNGFSSAIIPSYKSLLNNRQLHEHKLATSDLDCDPDLQVINSFVKKTADSAASTSTPTNSIAKLSNGPLGFLSEEWRARIILLTVSAFYGTNFASVKILNDNVDPSIAALFRFTIAALVFSPNLFNIIKTNPALVLGGLEVGIYSSFGYWTQSNALETTSASIVAFICSLAVIVVPLLNKLFDKKSSSSGPWYHDFVAPIIATIGVGCLELGGSELPGLGSLWALGQPIAFGLGFWRIEKIIKFAKDKGDAQGFTGAMMLMVAAFSFVWTSFNFFAPLYNDPDAIAVAISTQIQGFSQMQVIAAIAWTGVVTTAITSYGENIAMKHLSAAESTIIYSTEPLWGTAFAAVTLGETIGANTIVGAALIIFACMWSSMGASWLAVGLASQETMMTSFTEVVENISENWIELLKKWDA